MARLKAVIAAIRRFYSPADEPLRVAVYTNLMTLVGAAVAVGLITGTAVLTIGTAVAAVLMVTPATEVARRLVTPAYKATRKRPLHPGPLDEA